MQAVGGKMEPIQFCYWLQGFAELNGSKPPSEEQWKAIRDHLNLVFVKKTPTYNTREPIARSAELRSTDIDPPTIAIC